MKENGISRKYTHTSWFTEMRMRKSNVIQGQKEKNNIYTRIKAYSWYQRRKKNIIDFILFNDYSIIRNVIIQIKGNSVRRNHKFSICIWNLCLDKFS